MKQPFVSIIIPVYNAQQFIKDCLESVLNQTLNNIEILCVDDCSVDNSLKILKDYEILDSRIKIFAHESNKGSASARNTALSAAQGDYVYFLDSDDILAVPSALHELYDTAQDDAADQVTGRMLYWWPETDERCLDWQKSFLINEFHACTLENCHEHIDNVSACNKLIRHNFLESYSIIFDESLFKYEDNPFSALVHCLSEKISYRKYTTYLYRQHKFSKMHDISTDSIIWYLQFDIKMLELFITYNIKHSRRILFYPGINWRILSLEKKFDNIKLTESIYEYIIKQLTKIINLIPKNDLHFFSEHILHIYELYSNGKYHDALNQLQQNHNYKRNKLYDVTRRVKQAYTILING
jgi:glycosyltransferase involved in cell wall biosynthesis